jgi:hypothetical protein
MMLWLVRRCIGDGQLQLCISQSLAWPAACILRRGDCGELVSTSVERHRSTQEPELAASSLVHRRIWSRLPWAISTPARGRLRPRVNRRAPLARTPTANMRHMRTRT